MSTPVNWCIILIHYLRSQIKHIPTKQTNSHWVLKEKTNICFLKTNQYNHCGWYVDSYIYIYSLFIFQVFTVFCNSELFKKSRMAWIPHLFFGILFKEKCFCCVFQVYQCFSVEFNSVLFCDNNIELLWVMVRRPYCNQSSLIPLSHQMQPIGEMMHLNTVWLKGDLQCFSGLK